MKKTGDTHREPFDPSITRRKEVSVAITRRKWLTPAITRRELVEFAQVAVLASLWLALHYKDFRFVAAAVIVTLAGLLYPRIFYPFAIAWSTLGKGMGAISSRVVLGFVFFVFVVPVGYFRKWSGKDPLQVRSFKKSKTSVFSSRDHVYVKEDLFNTF